ncbi:asparagine synthase (glutamine-hydrolyzing) [Micromonospora sp. KC606]|uniref:asparagine synthase (glutamine-hydrolyzing) n=1 Tax=Micromonospora sp. KC606 TaxID=2530379 RepID=UPI00104DD9FE|nr:asparagine synthase (glutamine-hydrolyzing) [Micromonospora sp. KC606]TDC83972.1 asparagine synthase (glutamine-hydrolyzing) [Micromonospora sp. KC606]
MCGITGWVDHNRDLSSERAVIEAMTRTMSCRGPDADGTWATPHALLGHRRLAVIDIDGGTQPMIAATPDGPVVITYSGEVYNYRELRAELERAGFSFRTGSDTEVVLTAYLAWGDRLAERLNGMFAFAVWDQRDERLLLVRDRLGVKPLYYQSIGPSLLFGSEPKAIHAHPYADRVVGLDGLREAFSWVRTPGHAVWAGLREVLPGTVVIFNRAGTQVRRYWSLTAAEHADDRDRSVAAIRELLEDIVDRQLVTDVPRCALLSGGLDSSLITALAQRRLAGRERLNTFAVDFVGHRDLFTPDPFRDQPDAPFAELVAGHAGTAHHNVALDPKSIADPDVRRAVVRAKDLPVGFGDADNSLYLLFRAVRERSTVALSGESADEVFGGYRWMHDSVAQRADVFPWVDHTHVTSPYTGLDVFDPGLREALDLTPYIAARYAEAVAEAPVLAGEDPFEARMRLVSYLHLTRYLRILLDRKDRLSMAVGLEVRVPFCDHRLVEYAFNTPWALKTFDGREKSLLRAAGAGLLPEPTLARRKAPYPSTRDPQYLVELQSQVRDLLAAGHPAADLADRDRLRALANAEPAAVNSADRTGVERWLDLAAWIDECRPVLRLS